MPTAPTITSVTPNNQETDVVLGTQITVLFSQRMDHATIDEGTFVLTGPGQTMIATPDQFIAADPQPITGREYITGAFQFDDTLGGGTQTMVTFTPSKVLRPDVTYEVLVAGDGGILSSTAVANVYGVPMVQSYEWTFTTGQLNLVVPPPAAPIPGQNPALDPSQIVVIPRIGTVSAQTSNEATGADLAQIIDFIFPASVNLKLYDPTPDILTSIEGILGDPQITVPMGLTVTPSWCPYGGQPNRKLTITIAGWPAAGEPGANWLY